MPTLWCKLWREDKRWPPECCEGFLFSSGHASNRAWGIESDQRKLQEAWHGLRALLPKATTVVNWSTAMTTPALESTPKATTACGDNSGGTRNRLRRVIRNRRDQQRSQPYKKLADYFEQLKATSGGTITNCHVNCVQVGKRLLVHIMVWTLLVGLGFN